MVEVSAKDVQPRAQTALASSPICELRNLRVSQQNGTLLISGVVSSYYHKQLAQEAVRAVCGEIQIKMVNSIRVE
jgi:osmotically-inducible protein OsmY